jgi:hypothetical protein
VWHHGNQYDGEWRAGKMHGQGTLKWITGAGVQRISAPARWHRLADLIHAMGCTHGMGPALSVCAAVKDCFGLPSTTAC